MIVRSVGGVIENTALVIVHGDAGAFKTTYAMTRQLSRHYGFPFPGSPPAPGNCIYVTGESLDRLPPLPHAWAQTFCEDLSPKHYFGQIEACRGALTSDKYFLELQSFLRSLPDKPDDIVIDHMVWLRGSSDDSVMAIVGPMIDRLDALRDEFDAMVTAVVQAEEHLSNHLTEGRLDAIWHVARPAPDVIHVRNTTRKGGGEHQGGRAICFRRRLVSIAGWTAPVFVLEYAGSIEVV